MKQQATLTLGNLVYTHSTPATYVTFAVDTLLSDTHIALKIDGNTPAAKNPTLEIYQETPQSASDLEIKLSDYTVKVAALRR